MQLSTKSKSDSTTIDRMRNLSQRLLLSAIVSLILGAAIGCDLESKMNSEFDQPLHCFTFDDYLDAGSKAIGRETWTEKDFDKWELYHDSIIAILKTAGSVSMDPEPLPDFYHSGDWFNTYTDGFSIENEKILSPKLLSNLTACVAAADPGATLEFAGVDGTVDGLHIFISSEGAFAYWSGLSALQCKERVNALGLEIREAGG